jgi:hypothetical protein
MERGGVGGGEEEEGRIRGEEMRESQERWTQEGAKMETGGEGGQGEKEAISTREEGMKNP